MGSVYLAKRIDGEFERNVALKFFGNVRSSISKNTLRRERQTLASLRHSGITRLLHGSHDELGQPWLAMPCIESHILDALGRACEAIVLTQPLIAKMQTRQWDTHAALQH
jgi:eukaryotic-like serine/threonine-protein kinase